MVGLRHDEPRDPRPRLTGVLDGHHVLVLERGEDLDLAREPLAHFLALRHIRLETLTSDM